MPKAELRGIISLNARQYYRALGKVKKASLNAVRDLGALAVVGGIFSVREALQFSKGMAEVNTIANLGGVEFEKLKRKVRDVTVELGIVRADGVEGLYKALSAGVPEENVIDFMRIAGRAAIAGVTEIATSVKGITGVLDGFHMKIEEADGVADLFFQTIRLGKLRFEDLADNLGKVAPIASKMGVSIEEMFAAFITMTRQEISVEEASTAMRGALVALLKPSPLLAAQFRKMGVESGEAAIKTFGLQGAFEKLHDAVDGDSAALQKLFPRVRGLMSVFALTGKNAEKAAEHLHATKDAAGATGIAFKIMSESADHQMRVVCAQVMDVALSIGEELLPVVMKAATGFRDWLTQEENMEEMILSVRQVAEGLLIVAENAGKAWLMFNKWGRAIENVTESFRRLKGIAPKTLFQAAQRGEVTGREVMEISLAGGGKAEVMAAKELKKAGVDIQVNSAEFWKMLQFRAQTMRQQMGPGGAMKLQGAAEVGLKEEMHGVKTVLEERMPWKVYN